MLIQRYTSTSNMLRIRNATYVFVKTFKAKIHLIVLVFCYED